MRARMALCYMQIAYEPREVDLKNKPQELLQASPKGTVPVLILDNGKILEESLDIILWAMPEPAPKYKSEIERIIKINDNEFKQNLNHYKYPDRFTETDEDPNIFRGDCERFINILEQNLSRNRYLIDNEISIADLAVFPLVRQFSKVDPEWFAQTLYTNVQRWIEDISSQDFFQNAMQKLPVWKSI